MHIAQMILAKVVISVILDEEILGDFEEEGEKAEKLYHDFRVAFATEGFDFVNVVLKDGGVLTVVVAVEFGNVVDLDVVDDAGSQGAKAGGAVAVVFAGFEVFEIVVFEFLFEREVVEFATESKLAVYFLLADVEVLDVEEAWMVLVGIYGWAGDKMTYRHGGLRARVAGQELPCRLASRIGSSRE